MNRFTVLLLCLLLSVLCTVRAQETKFAPDTISTNDVFSVTFTPDGKEVYFVKSFNTRDRMQIMMSRLDESGHWSPPVIAPFSGKFLDIDPAISPDGKKLFFNSRRPLSGTAQKTDYDIWIADRTADGWGAPYSAGPVVNSDSSDTYATVAANGNMYFVSRRPGGMGANDIYVSKFAEGKYTTPENIGAPVNTSYSDSNPYISPDEKFMIFLSDRPGNLGSTDLYITYRKKGKWTTPEHLGAGINTSDGEFCPFISWDGKYFYFSRSNFVNKQRVGENIYKMGISSLPIPKKYLKCFDQ